MGETDADLSTAGGIVFTGTRLVGRWPGIIPPLRRPCAQLRRAGRWLLYGKRVTTTTTFPNAVIHVRGTIPNEAEFAEKVRATARQIPVGCVCGHVKARHDSPSGATACLRCDCPEFRPNLA